LLFNNKKIEKHAHFDEQMNLREIAHQLNSRLVNLFLPDEKQRRPAHGTDHIYATDPHFKDLILFYEYFHGDTGKGLGARYAAPRPLNSTHNAKN
jgi:hypothetical protein